MEKDYLWLNLRDLPYFRAILRAVEARFYQDLLPLPRPILDLGCGDGHFASIAFDDPLDVGIDPWGGPLKKSTRAGGHRSLIQGSGNDLPFNCGQFACVISNSVLEHIPDLDATINEVHRVLQPEGLFVFCVPNHQFLNNLWFGQFFERLHLKFLAKAYRNFFNYISRHHHCDDPETWRQRLNQAGFQVERWWHYFSPNALHILEWGHYFGLPSLILHALTRRWILVPAHWNLSLTRVIVQACMNETSDQPKGSYTFFIARRNQD